MGVKVVDSENLKNYFFDIFKYCYDFYPVVKISEKSIIISSVLNRKLIKVIQPLKGISPEIILPVAIYKWKIKYQAKFKNIDEKLMEYILEFSEHMIALHAEIRNQLTKNNKIKFTDPIIILKTVDNLIKIMLDKLPYLQYSASKAKIYFTKFVVLESDIEYTIGNYTGNTKVQVLL